MPIGPDKIIEQRKIAVAAAEKFIDAAILKAAMPEEGSVHGFNPEQIVVPFADLKITVKEFQTYVAPRYTDAGWKKVFLCDRQGEAATIVLEMS